MGAFKAGKPLLGYGLSLLGLLGLPGCGGGGAGGASTSDATSPPVVSIPLGARVQGLSLSGPLAGRQAYALDERINLPGCWHDSVLWTGQALFYGASSTSFTRLLSGQGFVDDSRCVLPRRQSGDDHFDIYRATVVNGVWQSSYQGIDPVHSDSAASVSAQNMAYTRYDVSGNWDIFLTRRASENAWEPAQAFEWNSACPEDNPHLYAAGSKMIFESTRIDGTSSACKSDAEHKSLWFSQKVGQHWTAPTLIAGAPNAGDKNTQPWVDEEQGYLYWTADSECACIRRVEWINDAPQGAYENVITPAIGELTTGTADGKIVFVGEFSQSDSHAFFACAKAKKKGDGLDPSLFMGTWEIDVDLCVAPR